MARDTWHGETVTGDPSLRESWFRVSALGRKAVRREIWVKKDRVLLPEFPARTSLQKPFSECRLGNLWKTVLGLGMVKLRLYVGRVKTPVLHIVVQ